MAKEEKRKMQESDRLCSEVIFFDEKTEQPRDLGRTVAGSSQCGTDAEKMACFSFRVWKERVSPRGQEIKPAPEQMRSF